VTAARRAAAEPEDMLRAAVPLLLLLGAAALPPWAGVLGALLAAGVVVAIGRKAPVAWAWSAGVPAGAILAIRAFGGYVSPWEETGCTTALAPSVLWAAGELALVVGVVVLLAGALGAKPADLGLRTPYKYATRWAVSGAVAILGIGLVAVFVLGPLLGVAKLSLGGVAFLVPAVLWAAAAGVSEELAWRGALQGWLARTIGPWPAVLAQAVLSGVAWGVGMGSPLGGVVAGAAAVVLGATVVRTRSLVVALAWHVAFNVPLYALLACPAG
jgi:membrane protease YdiL (CAAX protease family)